MLDFDRVLQRRARDLGFDQSGDCETARFIGALVRLHRPKRVLELGTGLGLTTRYILDELDHDASLQTVELDGQLAEVAGELLGDDMRLDLVNADAGAHLEACAASGARFDMIFADAWPGKYAALDVALSLLDPGGLYVVDDMTDRADWPADHRARARGLRDELRRHPELDMVFMEGGTGVGVGCKRRAEAVT